MEVKTVLIVEDSQTQARLIEKRLQDLGLKVEKAGEGKQALEFLEGATVDLIISDINMPVMDGFELCKQVRSHQRFDQIPVILLSTRYDPADVIRGIEVGADHFLTKPPDTQFILKCIRDSQAISNKPGNFHPLSFYLDGKEHRVTANLDKVATLLLSAYANATNKSQELLSAQKELKSKNLELSRLNEQKNRFLGMAAHDLRNPLGAVKLYTELLQEKITKENQPEEADMLNSIADVIDTTLGLVNDFLDVSMIESGDMQLNIEEVNCKEMVEKYLTQLRTLAEKKNMQLFFECDTQLSTLRCDRSKFGQVITNLVTNAIKYSFPHKKIVVTASIDQGEFLFSVKDQGQGIPKEEQDKLFKHFSRTTVRTTGGESSSGLGLAIVKQIVKAHAGEVWAESKVGEGSTFYAKIPMNLQQAA